MAAMASKSMAPSATARAIALRVRIFDAERPMR